MGPERSRQQAEAKARGMRDANTAALMKKYRPRPVLIPWCDRHDDIAAYQSMGIRYCDSCFTEACGYAHMTVEAHKRAVTDRLEAFVAPRVKSFRPDPLRSVTMRHYAHQMRGTPDDPKCVICIGTMQP